MHLLFYAEIECDDSMLLKLHVCPKYVLTTSCLNLSSIIFVRHGWCWPVTLNITVFGRLFDHIMFSWWQAFRFCFGFYLWLLYVFYCVLLIQMNK